MNVPTIESPESRRERLSKLRRPSPKAPRANEVLGGGFIVIERTTYSRRLRPAAWPHECASYAEALKAVERLKGLHPDREFCIFADVEKAKI